MGLADETRAMAGRVLRQVQELHRAGICHRDLKADEIVVDGEQPLLIDFELGTEVDPTGPCYDVLGPKLADSATGDPRLHRDS